MSEQSRAEQFLAAFGELERHMRRTLKKDEGYSYKRLVDDMRARGRITDSQVRSLSTFGYLRNALAHNWHTDGDVIADPRESAVAEFVALARDVMTPPLLVDVVRHRVEALDIDSPLSAFMLMVKTKDFSQAPVLQGGRYVDMMTLGRLARWIAETRHYDWFNLSDTPVRSVLEIPLQAEEYFARCEPDIDIAQALNLFDFGGGETDGEGSIPVRGLIVLESGDASDSLRALVTYEDLPLMLRTLGRGA